MPAVNNIIKAMKLAYNSGLSDKMTHEAASQFVNGAKAPAGTPSRPVPTKPSTYHDSPSTLQMIKGSNMGP
jgi:hypothetical protein